MKNQYTVILYIDDWEFKTHREVKTFDTLQEAYDYYKGFRLNYYYHEIMIDNPDTNIFKEPYFLAWRDLEGHEEETKELHELLESERESK